MNSLASLGYPSRNAKPRPTGQNSMLDRGPEGRGWMGMRGQRDLLEAGAAHIDSVKIWGGYPALFPDSLIREKIAVYLEHGVKPHLGGLCFEVAWRNGKLDDFFDTVRSLGFTEIEISENYVTLSVEERSNLLRRSRDEGLSVIYEFGRKHPTEVAKLDEMTDAMQGALDAGATCIILEQGEIDVFRTREPAVLVEAVRQIGAQNIILETSQTDVPGHMLWLLATFGKDVNIGNVLPGEIMRLEAFRRGLGREVDFPFMAQSTRQGS